MGLRASFQLLGMFFFFLLLRSWFSTLWQFLCRFTPRQYPVISQIERVPGWVESGWRCVRGCTCVGESGEQGIRSHEFWPQLCHCRLGLQKAAWLRGPHTPSVIWWMNTLLILCVPVAIRDERWEMLILFTEIQGSILSFVLKNLKITWWKTCRKWA